MFRLNRETAKARKSLGILYRLHPKEIFPVPISPDRLFCPPIDIHQPHDNLFLRPVACPLACRGDPEPSISIGNNRDWFRFQSTPPHNPATAARASLPQSGPVHDHGRFRVLTSHPGLKRHRHRRHPESQGPFRHGLATSLNAISFQTPQSAGPSNAGHLIDASQRVAPIYIAAAFQAVDLVAYSRVFRAYESGRPQ